MKTKEIVNYITEWLKEYKENSNTEGFVVGLSGGIDSAVTASLAANTGLPTLFLEMPIYQEESQVSRAKEQIEALKKRFPNTSSVEVNLTDTFDTLVSSLPGVKEDDRWEMAMVNTRARLRMTTLYYFAGLKNYLVVGTGNKVEDFGIGFFTKYGDGGVDLSPIADLVKTEVYALGKELDVIDKIMKAPPTDGLWGDDRTDEDQIGATYPELEWVMEFEGDESILSERQKEVLQIYKRSHLANKHKMVPIPVCKIPLELKK